MVNTTSFRKKKASASVITGSPMKPVLQPRWTCIAKAHTNIDMVMHVPTHCPTHACFLNHNLGFVGMHRSGRMMSSPQAEGSAQAQNGWLLK
jgi:hypothetical protein